MGNVGAETGIDLEDGRFALLIAADVHVHRAVEADGAGGGNGDGGNIRRIDDSHSFGVAGASFAQTQLFEHHNRCIVLTQGWLAEIHRILYAGHKRLHQIGVVQPFEIKGSGRVTDGDIAPAAAMARFHHPWPADLLCVEQGQARGQQRLGDAHASQPEHIGGQVFVVGEGDSFLAADEHLAVQIVVHNRQGRQLLLNGWDHQIDIFRQFDQGVVVSDVIGSRYRMEAMQPGQINLTHVHAGDGVPVRCQQRTHVASSRSAHPCNKDSHSVPPSIMRARPISKPSA